MEQTRTVQLPPLYLPLPGSGEDFVVPDDGQYELVIAEILETRQASFQGKVKEGKIDVRFKVRIVGGEFDGVWFKQWFGFSLNEKSNLLPVLLAIRGGRAIDPTKPVELTAYLDKPFLGYVQVDEVPAREDPSRILKFAKVLPKTAKPVRKSAAVSAAPPPPPELDPDDDPFAD